MTTEQVAQQEMEKKEYIVTFLFPVKSDGSHLPPARTSSLEYLLFPENCHGYSVMEKQEDGCQSGDVVLFGEKFTPLKALLHGEWKEFRKARSWRTVRRGEDDYITLPKGARVQKRPGESYFIFNRCKNLPETAEEYQTVVLKTAAQDLADALNRTREGEASKTGRDLQTAHKIITEFPGKFKVTEKDLQEIAALNVLKRINNLALPRDMLEQRIVEKATLYETAYGFFIGEREEFVQVCLTLVKEQAYEHMNELARTLDAGKFDMADTSRYELLKQMLREYDKDITDENFRKLDEVFYERMILNLLNDSRKSNYETDNPGDYLLIAKTFNFLQEAYANATGELPKFGNETSLVYVAEVLYDGLADALLSRAADTQEEQEAEWSTLRQNVVDEGLYALYKLASKTRDIGQLREYALALQAVQKEVVLERKDDSYQFYDYLVRKMQSELYDKMEDALAAGKREEFATLSELFVEYSRLHEQEYSILEETAEEAVRTVQGLQTRYAEQ